MTFNLATHFVRNDGRLTLTAIQQLQDMHRRIETSLQDQTHVVFVSKIGDDGNGGLNANDALQTISAGVTKAAALVAAGIPSAKVHVLDGGEYVEDVTIPANILLFAPAAIIRGELAVAATAEIHLDRLISTANNQNMLTLSDAADGSAIARINVIDGRQHTGVKNVRNIGGGGKNLFVYAGLIFVGAGGTGIGDTSGGFGHIHFQVADLYLAGNNSVGILGSAIGANASNLVGWIDHILPIAGATGTTAISMTNVDAALKLVAAEIIADTAYNISAGNLYLACARVVGTRTGSPQTEITQQALDALDARITALGG